MSFNDDELNVTSQDVSGEKSATILVGKIDVEPVHNLTAPLEKSNFKVTLILKGARSVNDRCGLDLVTVLDVSGSMEGEKLRNVQKAMLFIIKKLSPIDRLSIVTFSENSQRLCPLRKITENSQADIEKLVNALVANGGTNISAGLQTGLKVLNDRRLTCGRAVGIMLLSDGQQNAGGDAAQVPVGDVPVYTFGFGADQDEKVLHAIANNSKEGTYSYFGEQAYSSFAFSQCLAGLVTVVVQNLQLIVKQVDSTIVKVSAGDYKQTKDDDAGSVTISFGSLYIDEVRTVIVDLLLDAGDSSSVLKYTYTYSTCGKSFDDPRPVTILVERTGSKSVEQEREKVKMEESRLLTAQMIKEARVMADDKKVDDAYEKLVEAQNLLEDVVNDQSNRLIDMLKSELQQMKRLMESQDIYEKQGRPFALSLETSHNRQRFATRGDVEKLRLFATPRMDAYLEQAKSFEEDPSKPLPSVGEDEKKELAENPLAPLVGALSHYIQEAIESLRSISNILNEANRA
ncbi:unnamed protein product [Camellia sinensis]